MYGLPANTERGKQLGKERVFAQFKVCYADQERFNADVSTMFITNWISEETVPGLKPGGKVKGIYVLTLNLKRDGCDAKNLELLAKAIPQNMVFALVFENTVRFAVRHERLHIGPLSPADEAKLELGGMDLDAAWANMVKSIGGIVVEEGRTLEEQIETNENRRKIAQQIENLTEKAYKEKQPRRKTKLLEQIKSLKEQLENI